MVRTARKEYLDENKRRSLPDEEKPPRHVGLSPSETGRLKVRRQDDWIWTRRLERYQPLAQSVYNGPVPGNLNAKENASSNKNSENQACRNENSCRRCSGGSW